MQPDTARSVGLSEQDVERLDARAQEVGRAERWDLHFVVAPNPEYVGLTADDIFIVGPAKLGDLAAHDIEMELDAIERGDAQILPDEDGDPRLFRRA
jgi:hypothetical protein